MVIVLQILPPTPRVRPCPVAPVNSVVIAAEVCRAPRQIRWVVEGVEGAGLALVEARTVLEGRFPCPPRVLRGRKVQEVGNTVVVGVRQVRTGLRRPAPHWEQQHSGGRRLDETPVTSVVQHDGQHQLTPPDTA